MTIRDAWDVVRHVRDPRRIFQGLLPARWRTPLILNRESSGAASDAEVLRRLNEQKLRLKAAAIDDGGRVDYARLRESALFRELVATAASLRSFDPSCLPDDRGRTAFWLNLYNIAAMHGVIALGIKKSVMEAPFFFGVVSYEVGGHVFSLDDIENGLLRANAPHPALGGPPFAAGDPRRAFAVGKADPRIHAALVCVAASCPAVRFYEAEYLDEQLDSAAANWVAGAVTVSHPRHTIELPLTYSYFRADFGGEEGIRAFLLRHATGDLEQALKAAMLGHYRLRYARYDWSLNRIA